MTTEALAADLELNALVAEKIMGWKWQKYQWWDDSKKDLLWTDSWGLPSGDDFCFLDKKRIVPWDLPNVIIDMTSAMEVRDVVRTWIFSKRMRFKKILQRVISERVKGEKFYLVHSEEIILLFEPVDIARAALEVLESDKP